MCFAQRSQQGRLFRGTSDLGCGNESDLQHRGEGKSIADSGCGVLNSCSDVLVQYDEVREQDRRTQRRAFFANANRPRIESGLKPRFVSTNAAAGLEPIPILRAESGQPVPPDGLCVVMAADRQAFTLHSDGQAAASVTLPTYGTTGGVKKAFLTPLAVTGDTLVVGVTAGVMVAWAWAQSGVTISTGR